MKVLISYLNSLKAEERRVFVHRSGTTEGYMRKCASVGDVLNPIVCAAIEREAKGKVLRQDLRPNDYFLIWPDLKAPKKSQKGVL